MKSNDNKVLANATETGSHLTFDKRVTRIILQQFSSQLHQRDHFFSEQAKSVKSSGRRRDRQKMRDTKHSVIQDGICESVLHIHQQIQELLNKLGISKHRLFFESLLHLVFDFSCSSSLSQRLSALVHFIRHILPDATDRCCTFIVELMGEPSIQDEESTPLFGEKFFGDLKDLFTHQAAFAASKTWKALQLILAYALSLFIKLDDGVDDSVLRRLLPDVLQPISFTGSAVMQLLKSLVFVINQGYQYIRTGSWTSFCYEETSMTKWIVRADEVRIMHINLNSPDVLLRKTPQYVLQELEKLVVSGKEISKFLAPIQKKIFSVPFKQILELSNEVHNSITGSKIRKAPLCILLNGKPSVGKTTFTDVICDYFAKYKGFEYNEDSKYTRNFADPFYSGYKTSHQVVILDDIAFEKCDKVSSLTESSMKDVIQIANNNVFMVNMADLADKGRVYCAPKLVIGTTNCKHLNALHLFETPYAALRRFPYVITINPREEVRDACGGLCLKPDFGQDISLIESVGKDWWDIEVDTPVPMLDSFGDLKRHVQYKQVLRTHSLAEFRKWLKSVVDNHDEAQDMMLRTYEEKKSVTYCHECGNETSHCTCNVVLQDGSMSYHLKLQRAWVYFVHCCHFLTMSKRYFLWVCDNQPLFRWGLQNFLCWLIEIFLWSLTGYMYTPMLVLSTCLTFGFSVYRQNCDMYLAIYWLFCKLPCPLQYKIMTWFSARYAPRWLKNQWGFFHLAQGLALLSGVYAAYSLFSSSPRKQHRSDIQGGVITKDVYYSDVEKSIALDFGAKVTSWKALPKEIVIDKISDNVVRLTCDDVSLGGVRKKKGVGLFVTGQVLITNAHLFKSGHHFRIFHPRMVNCLDCVVSDKDIIIDEKHDLMAIRFRNVAPFKNVLQLFPNAHIFDLKSGVTIISRDADNSLALHSSQRCEWLGEEELTHDLFGTRIFDKYVAFSVNTTQGGDCGSPYVVHSPFGPCIVAIHQAMKGDSVSGVALTQGLITDLISPLGSQIQGGSLIRSTCDFSIVPWSKDSNLRRIPNAHFYVYGTSQRRFPSKSKVVKSILYESCEHRGMKDIYAAPIMRDRKVWVNQAAPMVDRTTLIDHDLLDVAVECFVQEVLEDVEGYAEIRVLSEGEALNGVQGTKYIDKIPRKTSAGFPYNCTKSKFLTILPDGSALLDETIWEDARQIEKQLLDNERSMPVFMGSLKDEVITKAKREACKTRLFTGSPLAFSLVMRKYLLSVNAFIQNRRSQFECCVGVDALGPEWHDIAIYLKEFSPNFVAGDYKAYDKRMTPDLILAAGKILMEMCKRAGYTTDQLKVVNGIFYDIAFPVLNFDGDIVMTCGSEPSGHPLTVIVNSLVGSLLMRMAYISLRTGRSFKEDVRLLVYGDDNLMSTRELRFNHVFISNFLATQGLEYTMADKVSESRPFISFDECSFLKRTFRFHHELDRFVGPLDEASFAKMMMFYVPNGAVSPENWAVDVLDTYCREQFFHGREKHEAALEWCRGVISSLDLHQCVDDSHFISFTDLVDWYNGKKEDYLNQDAKARTFSIIQCGSMEDEICSLCAQSDCIYFAPKARICPRCKRCRPLSNLVGSRIFLGCLYCDIQHPLDCDNCHTAQGVERCVRGEPGCAFFYCDNCTTTLNLRNNQTVLLQEIIDSVQRDPQMALPTIVGCCTVAQAEKGNKPGIRGYDLMSVIKPYQIKSKSFESTETNPSILGKDTREKWNSSQIQDGEDSVVDQETVSFMDMVPCSTATIASTPEEVAINMAMDSVSLADFLSRPVLINTFTWNESDSVGTKLLINPAHALFNNTTIKYKLNNWGFIRFNLKVRLVFNASPFYYGSMMANWRPLHNISPSMLHYDGSERIMIPFSQMPGRVMIEPQCPQDVEVDIPFFWPANFLRCSVAQDFVDFGTLYFNIITALQSANGVTGTGITIKAYGWATDIVLSGPTIGLSMQDGETKDEYAMNGPVSKPASAIANVAARLGDIPVIGPFATATQIGATAVAHIAKLFGFTNVPVIDDQKGFQPRALPPMASTDIGFPFEKLTVDAKNELTIDHRSVGLGPEDELPIASIVQRESFLLSCLWTTDQAADTKIFSAAVTPQLYSASSDTNRTIYMTPMCWLSTMFNYWRGDVIFRFRLIASKYHRGRLKISYDPYGYAGTNVTTDQSSHLIITKIVDISEDTNVEMRIPYQQYCAWLRNRLPTDLDFASIPMSAGTYHHTPAFTNGNIVVTVQTALTAPVASSTVTMQVFVRGAENMDFASPSTVGIELFSPATIQDGEDAVESNSETPVTKTISGKISRPVDHLYLTYMGERVASLRVLIRRPCKVMTWSPPVETVNDYISKSITLPRVPLSIGYDTHALSTVKGLIDTETTYKFNWTCGNFLSYVAPAFRGSRGSVNWSANVDGGASGAAVKHFVVTRDKAAESPAISSVYMNMSTDSANQKFWHQCNRTSGAGSLVANCQISGAANWQMPFYSIFKFAMTDMASQNDMSSFFSTTDMWSAQMSLSGNYGATAQAMRVHFFAGAGTDFDLLYFMHVPTYQVLSALPTPV